MENEFEEQEEQDTSVLQEDEEVAEESDEEIVETGEDDEVPPTDDETETPKKKTAEEGLKAALHAEREAKRELKRKIEEIEARLSPPPPPRISEEELDQQIEEEAIRRVGKAPTKSDDGIDYDDEKFVQETLKWDRKVQREAQKLRGHIAEVRAVETRKREFISKVRYEGIETYGDFLDVAYIPEGSEGLFAELDNAKDVAYALGKDPASAKKLSDLIATGGNASLFLGKFSAQVTPRSKLKEKETKPKPTQTTRPGSGGEQSTDSKAIKAARDEAMKSGNFAGYLEKIGAF